MSISYSENNIYMACAVSLLCLRELAVGVAYTKAAAGAKGFLHTHTPMPRCMQPYKSGSVDLLKDESERTSSMQCTHTIIKMHEFIALFTHWLSNRPVQQQRRRRHSSATRIYTKKRALLRACLFFCMQNACALFALFAARWQINPNLPVFAHQCTFFQPLG